MRGRRLTGFSAALLLLAACARERPGKAAAGGGKAASAPSGWTGELRPGGAPIEAALAAGEVHRYRLALGEGQLLRVVVDQRGIDAVVTLQAPGGEAVIEADRLINDRGPELVLAVSEKPGDYALLVRGSEGSGPGRYQARIETLRPATAEDRLVAATYRSFTEAQRLPPKEAVGELGEIAETWHRLGDAALEAEALDSLARAHFTAGEWQPAADLYRRAVAGFERAGDRRWEALARTNLASSLMSLAEVEEAIGQATTALALARREDDRLSEAKALHLLGQAHQRQGELQLALDDYEAALALWPPGDRNLRPNTLHNLGVLHAWYLGDPRRGRELLAAARDAWAPALDSYKARTLDQLGRLEAADGQFEEARRDTEQALALQGGRDLCGSAVTRVRLALIEEAEGHPAAADARVAEAVAIVGERSCPRSEPTVRFQAAGLAERRGDAAAALAGFGRCRELYAGQGDRTGLAESLAGVARAERALGDRPAALAASRQGLAILEGVRPTILREDLRESFFSSAQSRWDFAIGLLLEMGRPGEAWAAAEQGRARALRDLLAEAGGGVRRGVDPELASRERELQHQLNVVESRRLGVAESKLEQLETLRRQSEALVGELEAVRGQIRRGSAEYAALTRPEALRPEEIQRQLLDDDTLLLEFRLGEEGSALWAVTRDSLAAFRLPPRREVEALAVTAERWMRSIEWPGENPPPLCELSRMLLAPVGEKLGKRRLVVVPDGALEALAFAALPDPAAAGPCAAAPPLAAAHEIAYLPSVATLAAQRRRLAARRPASGWIAVVADPVYEANDERIAAVGSAGAGGPTGAAGDRGAGLAGAPVAFHRLAHAGEEAAALLAAVPPDRAFAAEGFAASRATVLGGALAGFRILHFATHGILDAEQPLLSFLALSRLDAAGRPVDGTLPAHEIYGLDLPAELVVLSACDTALGRQVRGEGLVAGLPRAFLYAGAERVLVSLWAVPDASTRDLMTRFYAGLLGQGLPPARALQEAQRALWSAGRPPYQWAGFALLGDWRPLPPFDR